MPQGSRNLGREQGVKHILIGLLAALTVSGTEIAVDAGKPLNVAKGGDDVAQLRRLALNVGSEFAHNRVTDAYLKDLGIRCFRLINVGISGRFDGQGNFVDIKPSASLEGGLRLCRELGAYPHIVIPSLPEPLLVSVPLKVTRHRALGIDWENNRQKTGPTDYKLLENWYFSYFEYVKIERGFKDAVFEIFNEPDLGTLIYPTDNIPPKGSDAAYQVMLKIYRVASAAAKRFEAQHPDCKLLLGAPSGLAFTYKRPDGGWTRRFVADCAREKLKLDYLSLHNYASVATFHGEMRPEWSNYPSFPDMLAGVQAVIDRDLPGLPVWLTEYGAHHNVAGAIGEINGTHDGAAFSLDCLTAMLELGIDKAIYLVCSDLRRPDATTKVTSNMYSWCSFMVSPGEFGYPYPKAPYHAYRMVAELSGQRVAATASGGNVRAFAAADLEKQTLRVLLWNYATYIPEGAPPIEEGKIETVRLRIANAVLPGAPKAVLRLVDHEHGDILSALRAGRPVNLAVASPQVSTPPVRRDGRALEFEVVMPPGSVAMLELGSAPAVPSLLTPYPEEAELLLKTMRDTKESKPAETLAAGEKLLPLRDLQAEQKLDALILLVLAAEKTRDSAKASEFAQAAAALCRERHSPLPFAPARCLAEAERGRKNYEAAIARYRQALAAPDCGWRSRFGTELAVIECLNAENKLADVVAYCDGVLAGNAYAEHPELLGDFRLRKLQALANLGQTEAMSAVYRELLASQAQSNAKLGGVIAVVGVYRAQKEFAKALAEGKIGLELPDAYPGLLGKLKALLKQVEDEMPKAQ